MTAVEWLEQEIFRKYKFTLQQLNCQPLEEAIQQAKEMEKEQIIEMHDKGFDSVVQSNDEFAIAFAEWCLKIRFEPIENVSVEKLLKIYKKDNL